MNERKRVIFLVLIMAVTSLIVAGATISMLYRVALDEESERLVETAQSQARLIEAVARFDAIHSKDYPEGPLAATLSQIVDAHEHYKGFGETGEFTLARREGHEIVFLLSHRHHDLQNLKPVPFDSKLAEPMRRALSGLSGTVVGFDYRGELVLAAHEPVAELDLGIVAKIDVAEIRAPFVRSGVTALCFAVLVVLAGSAFFLRISNPIIRRLQEHGAELRKSNEKLTREIKERKQAQEDLRKRTHELGERVKELSCLYGISSLRIKRGISFGETFQGIVDLLPPSWQYPNITCARIILEDEEYVTENFKETDWKQSSEIIVHGESIGSVDVFYLEERPESDEGPFMKEERSLIKAIAERLGRIIEHNRAEEALRKAHDELERRVEERTAELSKTNALLKQEIAERKRAEEALRLNESRLEALVRLSQIKDLSLNETADFVLEEGVKLTKSEIGFLGFVNELETDMAIHAWSKNAMEQCSVIDKPMHFPIEAAGLWGEAVRKRKPVVINDYSIPLTQKKGYPEGHVKLSRFMVVPLLDRGRIIVVAGMANKLEEYDLTDIHQLTLLLDGMWRIVQHKRDEEALRRSEVELRRLSSELLRAHEEESKRIGQELHDGLAQTLSAIKVWAEAALKQIEQENPAEVANSLEFILPLAQGAVEEVRRIIRNLRPSILDDLGLVATISWLCQEFEKIYAGIGVERQIDIREDDLADSLKIIIFRVLQEALNNIAKHSQADLTHITMKKTEGRIQLTIIDNGVGFDAEQALSGKKSKGGIGLASMKERTKLSGGSFSIVSSLGNGTTIRAEWPANASI